MSRIHDPGKKAAVLAALEKKQPVTHIARTMGVPVRTIYCWRNEQRDAESGAPEASAPADTSDAPEASAPRAPEASAPIALRAPRAPRPASPARAALPAAESALRAELRETQRQLSVMTEAFTIALARGRA